MGMPGLVYNLNALGLMPTPYSGLPTPSESKGMLFYCEDYPSGSSLLFSDGAAMRPFARGGQFKALVTDVNGRASWTFAPAFSAAPVPMAVAVNAAGGAPNIVEIEAGTLSPNGVTFTVKRYVLGVLGLAQAGVPLQAFAFPPTA